LQILQILKINVVDTAASRDNIQDPIVIILPYICYVYSYMLCLFPILDDHEIVIYLLHNQGQNQI
jgi:hypothetical protein